MYEIECVKRYKENNFYKILGVKTSGEMKVWCVEIDVEFKKIHQVVLGELTKQELTEIEDLIKKEKIRIISGIKYRECD
jgi:hypothetical protein